ncbi:hypothetical protein N9E76_00530 [bacterium]|nr:hypothetical protein [bacterium]
MYTDRSPFLNFGPSSKTELFGVKLDSWVKWWSVSIYTFISTAIAAFASDSIVPWITNTIQDHKTIYIPYNKITCLLVIQTFTFYAVTQSVIGLFVALSQVDFMLIRLLADFVVNHFTTFWFLKNKRVDIQKYKRLLKQQHDSNVCVDDDMVDDIDLENLDFETERRVEINDKMDEDQLLSGDKK